MKAAGRLTATALIAVATYGCSVGPNYHPPAPDVPMHWSEAPFKPAPSTRAQMQWWQAFNDPELDSLIDRAIRANLGMRLAEARIRETRAKRAVAAAPWWPSLDAAGLYARRWQDVDVLGELAVGPQSVTLGAQP